MVHGEKEFGFQRIHDNVILMLPTFG